MRLCAEWPRLFFDLRQQGDQGGSKFCRIGPRMGFTLRRGWLSVEFCPKAVEWLGAFEPRCALVTLLVVGIRVAMCSRDKTGCLGSLQVAMVQLLHKFRVGQQHGRFEAGVPKVLHPKLDSVCLNCTRHEALCCGVHDYFAH